MEERNAAALLQDLVVGGGEQAVGQPVPFWDEALEIGPEHLLASKALNCPKKFLWRGGIVGQNVPEPYPTEKNFIRKLESTRNVLESYK